MGGITSLGVASSGMRAAQAGLYVTGHNMANVDTQGYTRQRVNQVDFKYQNIGSDRNGNMGVGLGTNVLSITQIRNKFLDITYRDEASRLGYYETRILAGVELETIVGELQSDYRMQSCVADLWDSLNQLSLYQPGLESRGMFVSTAITFLDKAQNVYKRMVDYQNNLNDQVKSTVTKINQLVAQIENLNKKVVEAEMNGDHANDYRDSRNYALDELSKLIKISYKENNFGYVNIMAEGSELLVNGHINKMGLKYTAQDYGFVEPIFTNETGILPYDTPANQYTPVFNYRESMNPSTRNDSGLLKSLIYTRGFYPANFTSQDAARVFDDDPANRNKINIDDVNVNKCFIPGIQWQLDTLVHSIVTMINDAIAPSGIVSVNGTNVNDPDAPWDLNDQQSYTELFKRELFDRFGTDPNGVVFNKEELPYLTDAAGNYILNNGKRVPNPNYNVKSLYSIMNLEINPRLLDTINGGHNLLNLSPKKGELENNSIVLGILEKWKNKNIVFDGPVPTNPLSVDEAYRTMIDGMATQTNEAMNYVNSQQELVMQADLKRQSMSAVSLDEEMTNMMKYQHAYNAASRVLNVIDSMIDKIVNGMGR